MNIFPQIRLPKASTFRSIPVKIGMITKVATRHSTISDNVSWPAGHENLLPEARFDKSDDDSINPTAIKKLHSLGQKSFSFPKKCHFLHVNFSNRAKIQIEMTHVEDRFRSTFVSVSSSSSM
jgi:hypothetical protein